MGAAHFIIAVEFVPYLTGRESAGRYTSARRSWKDLNANDRIRALRAAWEQLHAAALEAREEIGRRHGAEGVQKFDAAMPRSLSPLFDLDAVRDDPPSPPPVLRLRKGQRHRDRPRPGAQRGGLVQGAERAPRERGVVLMGAPWLKPVETIAGELLPRELSYRVSCRFSPKEGWRFITIVAASNEAEALLAVADRGLVPEGVEEVKAEPTAETLAECLRRDMGVGAGGSHAC